MWEMQIGSPDTTLTQFEVALHVRLRVVDWAGLFFLLHEGLEKERREETLLLLYLNKTSLSGVRVSKQYTTPLLVLL